MLWKSRNAIHIIEAAVDLGLGHREYQIVPMDK